MNGVFIDVPQLAYKTWCLQVVDKESGKRLIDCEEQLREDLKRYQYDKTHEHVR